MKTRRTKFRRHEAFPRQLQQLNSPGSLLLMLLWLLLILFSLILELLGPRHLDRPKPAIDVLTDCHRRPRLWTLHRRTYVVEELGQAVRAGSISFIIKPLPFLYSLDLVHLV